MVPCKCWDCDLRSVKNGTGHLIGFTLNLSTAFGGVAILMILSLSIQEHVISFICFYHGLFPSSVSYSFQSTGLLPH